MLLTSIHTHHIRNVQAIFMAEVTSEQTGDIVNFVSSDIRKIYDGMQVRSTYQFHVFFFFWDD